MVVGGKTKSAGGISFMAQRWKLSALNHRGLYMKDLGEREVEGEGGTHERFFDIFPFFIARAPPSPPTTTLGTPESIEWRVSELIRMLIFLVS